MTQEPLLLQLLHGPADRRGRDAEMVSHPDVLGADRLRPHDVALHHEFEDAALTLVEIGSGHGLSGRWHSRAASAKR